MRSLFHYFSRLPMPLILRIILIAIPACSVASTLWHAITPVSLEFYGPAYWLPLSYEGVMNYYLWQYITYAFVLPVGDPMQILQMLFLLYLLYSVGISISHMRGPRATTHLFLGGALAASLAASIAFQILPQSPIPYYGPQAATYATLIAWIFLYPEAELYVFMTFPMKARHLILTIICVTLFTDLSGQRFVEFWAYLSGVTFGYMYALLSFEVHSPFQFMYGFERRVLGIKRALSRPAISANAFSKNAKIYDFKTGNAVLSDDEFVDACLEKISRLGKDSLTFYERLRFWKASRSRKSR